MGWTPLFLQNQPLENFIIFGTPNMKCSRAFFGEKRIDQKIPEKSKIFQARKHEVFGVCEEFYFSPLQIKDLQTSKNGCFLKVRKSIIFDETVPFRKRLNQLNFNCELEL
jgi:hypothetical protein